MTRLLLDGIGDGPFALTTDGVTKRYGAITALADVDLRVPDGAVYLLVGPNGAGKSTLIRALMHLVRLDAGRAYVLGLDVARAGPEVRAQIGYVPESDVLAYPWLSVRQLIQHHAAYYPTWDHQYAARLATAFELRLDQKSGALSKGQRRRVQLLLALAHRPPVLLLDEPSDGLDHVARDQALTLLIEHLADSPATVLISTHRADEFERLIDHVGVLQRGALLGQTTRERLQQMLRRYRADVPDGWSVPPDLAGAVVRRGALGRAIDWTVLGDESHVVHRLTAAGAVLRDVASLSLDEAAVALLSSDGAGRLP